MRFLPVFSISFSPASTLFFIASPWSLISVESLLLVRSRLSSTSPTLFWTFSKVLCCVSWLLCIVFISSKTDSSLMSL